MLDRLVYADSPATSTGLRSPVFWRWRRLSALGCIALLSGLFVSGCASLTDFASSRQTPIRGDRFVLPDEDTDVVGAVQVVVARDEDTLPDFARRYGLGHDEIVAANPDRPLVARARNARGAAYPFVLPDAPREGIVLNLATLRLFYYPELLEEGAPQVVITHPARHRPRGLAHAARAHAHHREAGEPDLAARPRRCAASMRRQADPLPAVVKAGPGNIPGAHAMRLSRPSYLLHGTNKPYGVGMRVSHGCVRLYPEDIAELFADVPVGTDVRIINQPYLAGWNDGLLHLEAHEPLAEDAPRRWKGSLAPMERVIKAAAGDAPDAVDWQQGRSSSHARPTVSRCHFRPVAPGLDRLLADARSGCHACRPG